MADMKESPADKAKREALEKAEQDKLDAEKAALEEAAKKEEAGLKADQEALQKKADMEAAKLRAEELTSKNAAFEQKADTGGDLGPAFDPAKHQAAHDAAKALENIAIAYPLTTPDEHVVFGFAGQRFTLGQLRDLFALKRPR